MSDNVEKVQKVQPRPFIITLLRGGAMIFLLRILGAGAAFGTQVYLARTMGSEQLGIYVFAFSTCIMLALLSGLGFPTAAIRFVGKYFANNDDALIKGFIVRSRLVIFSTGILFSLITLFLVVTGLWETDPSDHPSLFVALVSVPVFAVLRFNTQLANAFSWHQLAFIPNTLARPVLLLLILIAFPVFGNSLSAANTMFFHFLVIVAVFIVQAILLHKFIRARGFHGKAHYRTREWVRIALPLTIVEVFNQYFPELAIIMAGLLLPASDVGVLNAGVRIALLVAFGIAAIDSMTIPRISRLYASNDLQSIQRMVARTSMLKFAASLFALLVLVFWGKFLLGIFGEEFIRGYSTLLIIAGAQVMVAAIGPVGSLLSVTGHQDHCIYVYITCLVVAIISMPPCASEFGLEGVASVIFGVMLLWQVWMYLLVVRYLGIHASILSFRL